MQNAKASSTNRASGEDGLTEDKRAVSQPVCSAKVNTFASDLESRFRWRQDGLICVILLLLTLALYQPVRHFEFINYDDSEYVSDNVRVQMGLSAENVRWAFRTYFFENWHPLTWLSYMADYQLFGLNPGAFHLENVLFHLLNTVLVFSVFKRMARNRWASAFIAAVFALHPLHIESVAWVAERKDVLAGFFWMLTLWAYLRYVERPGIWRYLLSLLFFAFGLMAKPMLVTLPCALVLLDFWPMQRIKGFASQDQNAGSETACMLPRFKLPTLILEKAPYLLLAALSCIITFRAQHGARVSTAGLPITYRVANAAISYVRYIGKTVWPDDLAVFYPHPGRWEAWQVIGAVAVLGVITAGVGFGWRKRPYLLTGWLWFLGTLVPVIGLVQVGEQSMADRYMYMPMLGLLIMLAWGTIEIAQRLKIKMMAVTILGGGVVASCLALSAAQLRFWRTSEKLFEHTIAVTEGNTVAQNSLGDALLDQGRTNDALAHFSAALSIDPEDPLARGNVGNILLSQGRTEDALAKYQEGLRVNPKNPELNHNTGLCLAKLGRVSEAVQFYTNALQYRAEYVSAHLNLGNALIALGKVDDAISHYQEIVRLQPGFAPAHINIGTALAQQGKFAEAWPQFSEGLRLQPNNADAHAKFALALARAGKNEDAVVHLTEALRLKPEEAEYHFHLATVLQAEKKPNEAVAHYQQALRLKPDLVLALNNLAWMLATQEDATVRNGADAVRYAERACELSGRQTSFLIGTLAAAYAEAGRFPEAVNTAQKAAELAIAAGQKDLAATNQKLLELYKTGKPYRETTQK